MRFLTHCQEQHGLHVSHGADCEHLQPFRAIQGGDQGVEELLIYTMWDTSINGGQSASNQVCKGREMEVIQWCWVTMNLARPRSKVLQLQARQDRKDRQDGFAVN